MRITLITVAGFEDGERGPRAKECGWPFYDKRSKENSSPLELLERKTIFRTP